MACSSAWLPLFPPLVLLAGCAASCPPAPALPEPALPALPTVSEAEARPIAQPVWERIVLRDRLLRNTVNECLAILRAAGPEARP